MDNSTPDMSEKLVLYLDGDLSADEKNTLEQSIALDKNLQEELESLQSTREAIKLFGLQQKVAGIHQQMMNELQPPVKKINSSKKILRYSIRIAAGLFLIAAAYTGYNFFTLSPEKIFSSNYHTYELNTVRGDAPQNNAAIDSLYLRKEYVNILKVTYSRSFTGKENFLRGMSYLEINENDAAISAFKNVIEDSSSKKSLLKSEAEYYLALTYIRNKEYNAALALLNKIKNDPTHLYHEKISNKLIRQVKMLKLR